jgi:hypothetical protein
MIQDRQPGWVAQGTLAAEKVTGKIAEKINEKALAPAMEKFLPLTAQWSQNVTDLYEARLKRPLEALVTRARELGNS